ncbi:QueT transporter family protein [Adlercreutzia sp. ZJ154]|uniref:QueT transporter family protein n=1 Tax=Adlercreutzia sp. ZJ154 TaxID=2709790 RepID=UPI001F14CCC0|nr:QueT transporter family protein [Adlercreutzia sp. ZJ154]
MNDSLTMPKTKIANMPRSRYIAQAGMIAALYAAATLICMLLLQGLAWGPVQFRISEAVCVVAVLTPAAIPGLTVGCVIANLVNMVVSGTGALGLLDVVFGSTATLIGAALCWKLRQRPALAIGCFVLTNALIVPAYLPLLLQGLGFYTIPFTNIALDGAYLPMYLFGLIATGIGEALVIYVLGMPLLKALQRFQRID